eukprot:Filipodium_phascolosomae@DN1762_c0_g1_i1.p1
MSSVSSNCIKVEDLPPKIVKFEYAVRGAIVSRSQAIDADLKANPSKYSFDRLTPCNIGNPHPVGQRVMTFHRQVMAGLSCPGVVKSLPEDVQKRVAMMEAHMGAYSHSKGVLKYREMVVDFLTKRDGHAADVEDIFMTEGASGGGKMVMELLLGGESDGILVPIPQYPLYSATIVRLGGSMIPYYLEEDNNWSLDMKHLENQVTEFRSNGGKVRAMVMINPGNPTGAVLSKESIMDIIKFCEKEGIILMADEVYQTNIYAEGKPFVPVRKEALGLNSKCQIISFHSASKGIFGECGFRGGFMHLMNIDPTVVDNLYKMASVCLCSNILGQAMMASIVTPPKEGDVSYNQFKEETEGVFNELKRKAKFVEEAFNKMKNMSSQSVDGAMYAFARIKMPEKAIEVAKSKSVKPDFMYCMDALEATGLISVPGSGFGQQEGSYHIRICILPAESRFKAIIQKLSEFNDAWMAKYS